MNVMKKLLLLTMLFGSKAYADVPAEAVGIRNFSHSGSGCGNGTVLVNISSDNKSLTAVYSDFVLDSEIAGLPSSKNCVLQIQLASPPGWTYSMFGLEQRGFADVDAGVTAHADSSFQLNNSNIVPLATFVAKGPYYDNYEKFETIVAERIPFGTCNGTPDVLTIRSEIRLKGKKGHGVITVDSLNGSFAQYYGLAWRRCDAKHPAGFVIETRRLTNPRGQATEYMNRICPNHPRRTECASGKTKASFIGRPNNGPDTYECRCT